MITNRRNANLEHNDIQTDTAQSQTLTKYYRKKYNKTTL